MEAVQNLFSNEPALVMAVIEAVLVLLVAFGVPISNDQKAAVIGLASAVLALVGGLVVRSQVTPTSRIATTPVAPPTVPPAAPAGKPL